MTRVIILFLLVSICPSINAQTADSLWSRWRDKSLPDSSRLYALNDHIWDNVVFSNPDAAEVLALEGMKLSNNINCQTCKSKLLNLLGVIYLVQQKHDKATEAFKSYYELSRLLSDSIGMSGALNNLGYTSIETGDTKSALKYLLESKDLTIALRKEEELTDIYLNLGSCYYGLGDIPSAETNYSLALKLAEKYAQKELHAKALGNMALLYDEIGDFRAAIRHLQQASELFFSMGDFQSALKAQGNIGATYMEMGETDSAMVIFKGIMEDARVKNFPETEGSTLHNLGNIAQKNKSFKEAEQYYRSALKIKEQAGNLQSIGETVNGIAGMYYQQGDLSNAQIWGERALRNAVEIGRPASQREAAFVLKHVYRDRGNFKKALEMEVLYHEMKDSLSSDENRKVMIRQQERYTYEKEALADSLRFRQQAKLREAVHRQEVEQQKIFAWSGAGASGFALLLSMVMYRSYRRKKRDNLVILQQKSEVEAGKAEAERQKQVAEHHRAVTEEKNKEITDSIQYAKRLQLAILPSSEAVNSELTENFILYQPKDIVAGDFYWLESTGNSVWFAVADCTGHGVPGALVSVVCSNALHKAVREMGISDPGQILDQVTDLVLETFARSGEGVKDGMDIALCHYQKDKNILTFSGANNPLYLVRNAQNVLPEWETFKQVETDGLVLTEFSANKQPVGHFEHRKPFQSFKISIESGDTIYLSSDGFADQFGGPKGKKFMYKPFKKMLISINNEAMATQHEILSDALKEWKGNVEQVDDVCVMGVKF